MPAKEYDELKQQVLRTHLADLTASGAIAETDYVARGYLDPQGVATPLGEEFLHLHDAGLITRTGELTEEGQVYATSRRDSFDADPAVFRKREERGLNELDKIEATGDSGFWSMLGDFATKGVPNLYKTGYNAFGADIANVVSYIPRKVTNAVLGTDLEFRKNQTIEQTVNGLAENLTGGVLASEPLAAGAIFGSEKVLAQIQGKTDEAYAAKQEWEKHNAEITELKGAEMMEFLTGSAEWLKAREALVAEKGEDAVKKDEEFDRLAGNFILDPSNIATMGVGAAINKAGGVMARASLHAEKLAMKAKTLRMGQVAAQLERATLEAGATKAAAVAEHATERAAAFRAVGNEAQALRYEATAATLEAKAAPVVTRIEQLVATEADLAAKVEKIAARAGVAETIVAANAKIAAVRQLPARAIGEITETVGTGLVKTDAFLIEAAERLGIDGLYKSVRSLPGRIGTMAAAPVTGLVPAAVTTALGSGPLLQSLGNFSKVLGRELIMERGSVPFWRRVANNSTISKTQRFLAHRADELTLGGRVAEIGKPVIRATAAAYPMNLAFNVLADPDHDLGNAAAAAFGPSLVFGGGTAGAGAMFKGTKSRLKAIRIADEVNFMRTLTDDQLPGYSGTSRGAKRAISTYAAAFPNLNWDFTHQGASHYDATTNTARINPASNNPLRALVGHEVLHYVTIRNQMQAVIHSMLLGDNITPGIVRDISDKSYLGPGPVYPETEAQTRPTRLRRLDSPERAKAHELLNSGDYPALTALFHSSDKIAPRNPAIPLILRRQKNGARLTNAELRLLRNDSDYNGMAQALAHSTSGQGKVAREALSMLLANHGEGFAPNVMAGHIREGMTASEMWLEVTKELKQIEKRTDISTDKRNDNRENWTAAQIKQKLKAEQSKGSPDAEIASAIKEQSQAEDFAAANNPEFGNAPIPVEKLKMGQEVTIDGEKLKVVEVVKARDSMGNMEIDHVVLQDGARFGRQVIDGGEIIFEERPRSEWDGGHYLPDHTVNPGILRHADGTLTPEFQAFKDAYEARMEAAGFDKPRLEQVAEEYFNENVVDHLMEMVETGELSRMAGKTQLGRLIEATIPRVPILRDFFFRTGGVMEAGGRHVMGNGLLADGLRELPEAKAMMRKLVRSSAGESATVTKRVSDPKEGAGTPLVFNDNDPIVDSFHPLFEVDEAGKPLRDASGKRIPLSWAKEEARSAAGLIILEEQTKRINAGYLPDPDEIQMRPDGTWSGKYIPKALIDKLAAKGILNSKQLANLRNISIGVKTGQGIRYLMINHAASKKGRGGKVRYSTQPPTLRETVPVQFSITKDGNILVHLMNVEQLDRNITTRAATTRGRALYDGNTEVIKQDIAEMMDLHASNTKTDKFYQDKYGPKWQEHQQFINTIFGLMTKEQQNINPMFQADKVTKDGVYRTYRLDRISKATKMDGTPMPFGYTHVKANFLPDGTPEQ